MASSTDHTSEGQHLGTTLTDKLFMVFLVLIVIAVTLLGVVNFKEALKVEASKSNGEAWVAWLTEVGTTRFEADTQHAACKGGVKPPADAKADTPGTWGACLAHIMADTDLKTRSTPSSMRPRILSRLACLPIAP